MLIEDEELLKAWIARDVESLTDAEPKSLAQYVLALIKKPLSDADLEDLCVDKLNVFLASHTRAFVTRLFHCLREGHYLPVAIPLKAIKSSSGSASVPRNFATMRPIVEYAATTITTTRAGVGGASHDVTGELLDFSAGSGDEAEPTAAGSDSAPSVAAAATTTAVVDVRPPSLKSRVVPAMSRGGGGGGSDSSTSRTADGGRAGGGDRHKAAFSSSSSATSTRAAAAATGQQPQSLGVGAGAAAHHHRGGGGARGGATSGSSPSASGGGVSSNGREEPSATTRGGSSASTTTTTSSRRAVIAPPSPARRTSPPPPARGGRYGGVRRSRSPPPPLPPRSPPGGGGGRGRAERPERFRPRARSRSYSRSRSRSPPTRSPSYRREKRPLVEERRRCRDFHEQGFCMRGDKCPYDHGPDLLVVENGAAMMEKLVGAASGVGGYVGVASAQAPPPPTAMKYEATSAAVGAAASGTGGAAVYNNPPPPGLESSSPAIPPAPTPYGTTSSQPIEGYNPEAPAISTTPAIVSTKFDPSIPPPPLPTHLSVVQQKQQSLTVSTFPVNAAAAPAAPPRILPPALYTSGSQSGALLSSVAALTAATTTLASSTPATIPTIGTGIAGLGPNNSAATSILPRAFGGLGGMGRARLLAGGFGLGGGGGGTGRNNLGAGGANRFKPYGRVPPALCSLVVRKIPPEQNRIDVLAKHFGKFGQITNLHVQYQSQLDTALVTFKSRREALNAYRSTEPILNNRFIKIYWQNQQPSAGDEEAGESGGGDQPQQQSSTGGAFPITGVRSGETADLASAEAAGAAKPPTNLNRPFSKTFTTTPGGDIAAGAVAPESVEAASGSLRQQRAPPAFVPLGAAPQHQQQRGGAAMTAGVKRRAAAAIADKEALTALVDVQRKKADLFEKLSEQQKQLLLKIRDTAVKEVRVKYVELLKQLDAHKASAKSELERLAAQIRELQQRVHQQEGRGSYSKETATKVAAAATPSAATTNGKQPQEEGANDEEGAEGDSKDVGDNSKKSTAASAGSGGTPNRKMFRVVQVSGCPSELNDELIVHMEHFGELFDFDITPASRNAPTLFTYKEPTDAQRAVLEAAKSFPMSETKIRVEWAPVSLGKAAEVVPDKERRPDERITPAELLAALDYDDYEEEEDEEVDDAEAVHTGRHRGDAKGGAPASKKAKREADAVKVKKEEDEEADDDDLLDDEEEEEQEVENEDEEEDDE